VKKLPVIADENSKYFWEEVPVAGRHLAVGMSRGTGGDIETCRAFDIIYLIFDLPARRGNVR
jgi:hypothetical protein